MKEKSDFLKMHGYELDKDSDNFINTSLKNVFTLDFLYDNPLNNIQKTHECSDSQHVQFFTDGTPNRNMTEELVRRYNFK